MLYLYLMYTIMHAVKQLHCTPISRRRSVETEGGREETTASRQFMERKREEIRQRGGEAIDGKINRWMGRLIYENRKKDNREIYL